MKTILLTGFEPFDGETVNPSDDIARCLDGQLISGHRVVSARLPCVFGRATRELRRHMRRTKPVLVVCLGQAGGRAAITPERVAVNVDDARIPDNAGVQPSDRPVVRGGPAAYWSTLPVKAMVAALRRRGWPAAVSSTAGSFVCNHVFYGLMHGLRGQRRVRGGFVHVPWLPAQAKPGQPSLALETMVQAVKVALAVAARPRQAAGRER